MAQDISASDKPAGTKAELQALNLPLNNHSTCSRPHPGNKGCRYFDTCRFRPIRDGLLGHLETRTQQDFIDGLGSGPDFIGFQRKVGSNGAIQGIGPILCVDWYEGSNNDRMEAAARTGDAFGPMRYAGQTIVQRYRVEVHRITAESTEAERDEARSCPECKKGDCNKTEERKRTLVIPEMKRPSESMKDVVFGNEIEREMHEEMQRQFAEQGMAAITNKIEHGQLEIGAVGQPTKAVGGVQALKQKAAS